MNVQLIDLVNRFDSGEIRLPLMQRDYVWRPAKVVKLLDSIYRRWPIGCFYVWNTKHDREAKPRHGRPHVPTRSLDSFYGFLLDGQQRLTSLSLALEDPADHNLSTRAFFDVENEQFLLGQKNKTIRRRIEADDPLIVALSDLVPRASADDVGIHQRVDAVLQRLEERGQLTGSKRESELRSRLHRVATMLQEDALCEEFKNEHEEDAIELFARLNKGGTSLSAGDVEAARLSREATASIVGPMREFVQTPEFKALGINFVFVTRALITVHRGNSSFSKLPKSWASGVGDIRESWRQTERGLRAAARIVHELGWFTRRWLPSANALIPIAYLLRDVRGALPKGEREQIKRFLLLTGLRSLFRGSVETTINTFINPLRGISPRRKQRAVLLVKKIPRNRLYKIQPEDIRTTTRMYSPVMQVYLAYLVSKKACSWPSARQISKIAVQGVAGDPLAVHHIFPKRFMQQFEVPVEKLNTVANYAILAQSDNAMLSDSDPALVHEELSPAQRRVAAEQLFFQTADGRLSHEAYDEFVDFRARRLAERLNEFLDLAKR